MRRRDVLDPEVERELIALDVALGDPGAAPESPEFDDLFAVARAVRAERPLPAERFAAELDAWAAAGFAAPSPRPARRRRPSRVAWPRLSRRALMPALGAAASLLVAVVVAASLLSSGEDGRAPTVGLPEPSSTTRGEAGGAQSLAAPSTTAPVPPGDVAPGRARRVERQASLVLTAPKDEVAEVSDGVIRATDEVGGIVQSSSVSSGDGQSGATFQLRVPARRLDDALARLSKLGHVRSRTQNSLDVTGSFVGARERLDAAAAERKGLLRQLARADTANETASVRARLRIVQSEIASARTSLRRIRVRTNYSTVSVTVQADGDSGASGGGAWTPGDAMEDAVRVLEVFAGVVLVALAIVAPVAVLGWVLVAAGRVVRRRRREQALSAG